MSEHALSHVKPPIRSPREAVQQLMPVIKAEAALYHRSLVGYVVPVRVLEKKQFRRLADIDASISELQSGREVQAIDEHGHFIGAAVSIRIFENLDAVARLLAFGSPEWIFVKFEHPEPSPFIPRHRHWIDHIRLGRKQANLKSRRNREFFLGF